MRFGIDDFKIVKISSDSNYMINRQKQYESYEEAKRDMNRIYAIFKRHKKSNAKYKNVEFIIGLSETKTLNCLEGKRTDKKPKVDAVRVKIKTKGRPKYVIEGEKTKAHLHIAVYGMGEEKVKGKGKASFNYVASFVNEVTAKLNKNTYKDIQEYNNRGFESNRLFKSFKLKG